MANRLHGMALAALLATGCSTPEPAIEKIPVGSDIQLTRQDGGLVEGKLTAKDDRTVRIEAGQTTKTVPREQIADVRIVSGEMPAPPPPAARFREYTVPQGTKLSLRLGETVSSDGSRAGQAIEATLADPVIVDGVHVLPAGSAVRGEIASVQPAGKVKGRASLALNFTSVAAHAETYPLDARFSIVAPATKKADAEKIGLPAAGGAIVGAIIGGKKGAAVGAAVGGGAGTAVVLLTPGKEVSLPRWTELSVATGRMIEVKVPLK